MLDGVDFFRVLINRIEVIVSFVSSVTIDLSDVYLLTKHLIYLGFLTDTLVLFFIHLGVFFPVCNSVVRSSLDLESSSPKVIKVKKVVKVKYLCSPLIFLKI